MRMQGLNRGLGTDRPHQIDMNSPPLRDARAGRLVVCVSGSPEGGGYTCSLLVAEEKGGSHRILTRGSLGRASTTAASPSPSAGCLFACLLLVGMSVTRSVCLMIRMGFQENCKM